MDREKVIKALEYCVLSNDCRPCEYWMEFDDTGCQIMKDALALLKEQEDTIRIISADYEDLQKEHERLLDKKIPLITNGQEVVRCKDCRHCDQGTMECNIKSGWFAVSPNWYCADGERIEKIE